MKRFETADAQILAERWIGVLDKQTTVPGIPNTELGTAAPFFNAWFPETEANASAFTANLSQPEKFNASKGLTAISGFVLLNSSGSRLMSGGRTGHFRFNQTTVTNALATMNQHNQTWLRMPTFGNSSGTAFLIGIPLYRAGETVGLGLFDIKRTPFRATVFSSMHKAAALFAIAVMLGTVTLLILAQVLSNRRDAAEDESRYLAYHDPMTGLHNRAALVETLETWLSALKKNNLAGALVHIDIDSFKEINDSHGPSTGDHLIKAVAENLATAFPEEHLFRTSGDAFTLLLQPGQSEDDMRASAERVTSLFKEPLEMDDVTIAVSVSAGVAVAPEHTSDPQDLIRFADLALYRAKRAGRRKFEFYKPAMAEEVQRRRYLQEGLVHARRSRHLEVHYQPELSLDTGRVVGFEATLRWPHPIEGYISPSVFIPLAERNGSIIEIGAFALRTACREAVLWEDEIKVTVNISPVQLRSGTIVSQVKSILQETGLSPRRLELQIKENVFVKSEQAIIDQLWELRRMEVGIALNDFGTSHSSLSSISHIPISQIKIDQSFIDAMPDDQSAFAIVEAVVSIGRAIKADVTVKGVESVEQARLLNHAGCNHAQGTLYGAPHADPLIKPLPVFTMQQTLRERLAS